MRGVSREMRSSTTTRSGRASSVTVVKPKNAAEAWNSGSPPLLMAGVAATVTIPPTTAVTHRPSDRPLDGSWRCLPLEGMEASFSLVAGFRVSASVGVLAVTAAGSASPDPRQRRAYVIDL
jgi:hypothetical protein